MKKPKERKKESHQEKIEINKIFKNYQEKKETTTTTTKIENVRKRKPPKIYLKTISNNKKNKQERNIFLKKYRK